MDAILRLGPLMIATDRAVALVAIWAFVSIGALVAARTRSPAGRVAWTALLIGIVAARAGFVVQNLSGFMVEPWAILALWQGGFAPWIGAGAAAAVVVGMLGRQRATGLLLAPIVGLSLAYMAIGALTAPDPRPLPRGLTLQTLAGKPVSVDAMRGRPFVINLWATWCPPCRREMPMVIDVARGASVPVLLVNQGEPAERVGVFLSANDLAGDAIFLDAGRRVAAVTGASAYPTTLFVDAAGNVVRVHAGEISRAALSAAIRDLERTTV
ncbi:redoxin domain-containing protein [Sphingomonas sp. IW22]|uniref:redoxin domain-containing protein n=1 Tax=Sphingomonas sp. IW22 TaxID=3242489 RepID=UPI0035210170